MRNQPDPARSEDSPKSALEIVHRWLRTYEACVRKRNYEGAKQLSHDRIVGFGLERNHMEGIEAMLEEWRRVWPCQLAFSFDLASANILPMNGFLMVTILWTSRSVIEGAPNKTGRATLALGCFEDEEVLCLHQHWSAAVETIAQ